MGRAEHRKRIGAFSFVFALVACGGVANDKSRPPDYTGNAGAGGRDADGGTASGGAVGSGGASASGGGVAAGGVVGCVPAPEQCNGVDDDCDGLVDEAGTPPLFADGIDFSLPENCGACSTNCRFQLAFASGPKCVLPPGPIEPGGDAHVCDYDRCAVGYVDLDGVRSNGCEYECRWDVLGHTEDSTSPGFCGVDDECNGVIDDGLDQCAPETCGGCGKSCVHRMPHVAGTCGAIFGDSPCSGTNATCVYGDCDPGWEDRNGLLDTDGCEARTDSPTQSGPEVCDGWDNDGDGEVDETGPDGIDGSADPNDPTRRIGDVCGTNVGICTLGTVVCDGGEVRCKDPVAPEPETCNGMDDDCDGQVDEADDAPCGATGFCAWSFDTHFCTERCSAGEFPCPTGMDCVSELRVSTDPNTVLTSNGCVPRRDPR